MPKRIAIVEDEAELASLIEYNLARQGYEAQVFPGAKGTLKALEQWKPDLLLLDVMLPDVDGFELCRQVRHSALLGRTPVLFVFQSYNLLPRTSALDNVATPLMYQGVPRRERHARAQAVLERLGLGDRLDHEPTELSGGQQQRVGIARALVTEPAILLADEPTGNLDSHSGAEVIELFHDLHASGRTIILITHDAEVAAVAERQVHIRDGQVAA